MEKNPSEFYDEAYLRSPMVPGSPVDRWHDNGLFYEAAMTAHAIATRIRANRILDVGCGRGFVVRHLRAMGHDAHGVEYGKAALENSVCGAQFYDLTDPMDPMAFPFSIPWDLVVCSGVLSHIPEPLLQGAAWNLSRLTGRGILWTNILIQRTPTQQHHKTFRGPEFWRGLLLAHGVEEDFLFKNLLELRGLNRDPVEWSTCWRPCS